VRIVIVTPESLAAPLGNSVTAIRWAGILRGLQHDVDVINEYADEDCDLLIALHACRSAESVEAFLLAHPDRPVIVALSGTDLYRDLPSSKTGQRALAAATHIVALQECALRELDDAARARTTIIYQSAVPPEHPETPSPEFFDVCVLSHLREVKDPLRAAYAARLLDSSSRVRIRHGGRALEPEWETRAREEERLNSRYHWLGEQSHDQAMRLLTSSSLLVVSSAMEGGANVIAEAVVCGVPVLCSNIPGNVGMLGEDYPGYFRLHETEQLAALLRRAETDSSFFAALRDGIRRVETRFRPDEEIASWHRVLTPFARFVAKSRADSRKTEVE
jgi:putative glycosyltransferase (TIGR04348 family)